MPTFSKAPLGLITVTPTSTAEHYTVALDLGDYAATAVSAHVVVYTQGSSTAVTIKFQGSFDKSTWDYIPKFDGTDYSVQYSSAITSAAPKTINLFDTTEHQYFPIHYPHIRLALTFATSHVGASVQVRPLVRTP